MPKPTLLLRGGWERERSPGDSELGRQFRDWCLRTYGDSAKTKTVTRSKYQRIAEVLQGGGGTAAGSGPAAGEKGKFQFWVRSKGFRLGSGREPKMGQVVYVPVKTGSVSAREAAAGRSRRGARGGRAGAGWGCGCVSERVSPRWSAGLARPGRPRPCSPARPSPPGAALRVRGVPAPSALLPGPWPCRAGCPGLLTPACSVLPSPPPASRRLLRSPSLPPPAPGLPVPGAPRSRPRAGWVVWGVCVCGGWCRGRGGQGSHGTGSPLGFPAPGEGARPGTVSPTPPGAGPGRGSPSRSLAQQPPPAGGWGAPSAPRAPSSPPPWDGGGLTYPSPPLPRPRGRPGSGRGGVGEGAGNRSRREGGGGRPGGGVPSGPGRPGEGVRRGPRGSPAGTSLFCSGWGLGGPAATRALLSFELSVAETLR